MIEVKPDQAIIDYEKLTVSQLKDLCKERGLVNYANLRKSELINLLK
ncbi:MAG: Rho termination factor N-terminal domain-containing protein [Firmicutes bacterium]|nr:Rho termination factor N-terminal domain-containing protein [Bacillota bacterium]